MVVAIGISQLERSTSFPVSHTYGEPSILVQSYIHPSQTPFVNSSKAVCSYYCSSIVYSFGTLIILKHKLFNKEGNTEGCEN